MVEKSSLGVQIGATIAAKLCAVKEGGSFFGGACQMVWQSLILKDCKDLESGREWWMLDMLGLNSGPGKWSFTDRAFNFAAKIPQVLWDDIYMTVEFTSSSLRSE